MRAIQNTVNRVDREQEEVEGLEFKERIPKEYWKYYDINFNFNELFPYKPSNHTIEITPRVLWQPLDITSNNHTRQQSSQ